MTRKYLAIVLITYYITYSILTGIFGSRGLLINNQLRQSIPEQQTLLSDMQEKNLRLQKDRNRLEADYQRILEEAYKYGYIREDEFRIIFEDYTNNYLELTESQNQKMKNSANSPESRVSLVRQLSRNEILKLSIVPSIILTLLMFLTERKIKHFRKKNSTRTEDNHPVGFRE
ncbi:MAG: septum formation initiator family protein [Spirochaetia bacterium]|nr:septum formation initiator family protein [Spirochaetia bacterium]